MISGAWALAKLANEICEKSRNLVHLSCQSDERLIKIKSVCGKGISHFNMEDIRDFGNFAQIVLADLSNSGAVGSETICVPHFRALPWEPEQGDSQKNLIKDHRFHVWTGVC